MSREPLGDQAKRHGGSVIVQRTARCRIDRVGLSTIVAKRRSRVSRVESDLTRKGNSYCIFHGQFCSKDGLLFVGASRRATEMLEVS